MQKESLTVGYALLMCILAGLTVLTPAAAAPVRLGETGTKEEEGTPHQISVDPTSGGPGGRVTVTWKAGPRFTRDKSFVVFGFATPGHGGVSVTTEFTSPTQLTFRVPQKAACGNWNVSVFTRLPSPTGIVRTFSSNVVPFEIREACTDVPRIETIDPPRGAQRLLVRVSGGGFSPGVFVILRRLSPPPEREIRVSDVAIESPANLTFRLPASETACGLTALRLGHSDISLVSNAVQFYFSCEPHALNVLSYNVKMMVDVGFAPMGLDADDAIRFRDAMAKEIPFHPVMDDHDVVVLQEVFSDSHRETILEGLHSRYPARSRILGSDGIVSQDGGVIILSRWPIENCPGEQRLFGSACSGIDCQADKGVIYARINKEGQRYHIFGTHLNAGGGARSTRGQQLMILRDFFAPVSANEPVVIAGDFNIQRDSDEFREMLATLDVTAPTGVEEAVARATVPEGNYLDLGSCGRFGTEYLDYVLFSNRHRQPVLSTNVVQVPCHKDGWNLSDHYPVLGRFALQMPVIPGDVEIKRP